MLTAAHGWVRVEREVRPRPMLKSDCKPNPQCKTSDETNGRCDYRADEQEGNESEFGWARHLALILVEQCREKEGRENK